MSDEPHRKVNYVGAPAVFALEQACAQVCEAFAGFGCYLVGSAIDRPDWRDVDIRFIMRAAIDRARARIPFLLPEEETEAEEWARHGT